MISRGKNGAPRLRTFTCVVSLLANLLGVAGAGAYSFNYVVADMRQPAAKSGGTACPQRMRFDATISGGITRQWSTSLGTSPATILTTDQSSGGRLAEIEATVAQSFGAWTAVAGSSLTAGSLAPLARTSAQNACVADGINTVCFNQSDPAFSAGVLAFTRVMAADTIGEQVALGAPKSSFVGQILDADILLRPADSTASFATPAALAGNPQAYDLQSVLTHEIGHLYGFGHSGVWRAVMLPFVPAPGTFAGVRPTAQTPDAQLSDDDRTAVRALYHDPADAVYIGSIAGHVAPANPLALAGEPAGATGILAAQVVAVDAASGDVAAAAISGWSCSDPGPPAFDGSYAIQGLRVGSSQGYDIYAEPLDGPVSPASIFDDSTLCRNALTDAGWPNQFACVAPSPISDFSTRFFTGP